MFILIERYRGWKQITDFWEHKMGHFFVQSGMKLILNKYLRLQMFKVNVF